MPIFPKLSFALVSKNPAAIRLKAEEWEIEVRILSD
jgi:hypothetical protein